MIPENDHPQDSIAPAAQVAGKAPAPVANPMRSTATWIRLLVAYVRWRAGRGLDGVFIEGLDTARVAAAAGPVLFACSHSAWWDGLLVRLVEADLGLDGLVTMDGETLALNPYFRWFGVTPLYPGGLAALAGLRRLTRHLDTTGRCVWYFPQGRHRPTSVRPLGVLPGIEVMARMGQFSVVPVSIHYDFRLAPVPSAFLVFGAPVSPDVQSVEEALHRGHDRAAAWFDGVGPDPSVLVPSRVAGAEDGYGGRLLRWLTR